MRAMGFDSHGEGVGGVSGLSRQRGRVRGCEGATLTVACLVTSIHHDSDHPDQQLGGQACHD